MEKQLKCVQLLSLKEMTLRKVAVLLWGSSDILAHMSKFYLNVINFYDEVDQDAEWRNTVEDKIKDKILKLDLPESLTKEMIERIRPLGLDIKKWMFDHGHFFDLCDETTPPDFTKLCWTSAGSIVKRKTAENVVRSSALEINECYNLACLYCLEEDIPHLWEELPDDIKGICEGIAPHPTHFWPCILTGELYRLDWLWRLSDRNAATFYQYAFEYSVEGLYETAARYFFLKLSREEREDSLARMAQNELAIIRDISPMEHSLEFLKEKFSPILFLLSLMNPAQRMEIFRSRPIDILFSFLDWPCQDLFSENAGLFWTLLPPSSYGDLLRMMHARYTKSDFYVPKLLQELFVQSPIGFKKCFVDEESESNRTSACNFLTLLFRSEDLETIEVVFRNFEAADRIKLFFHRDVSEQLFDCVVKGRGRVVKVCVREATLTDEDRERLKGAFVEFLKRFDAVEIGQNSKRFLEFLEIPMLQLVG